MQDYLNKIAKRIGARMIIARKAREISQIDFAAMVGVSVKTVSQWETGVQEPRISQLIKAGEVLNVNVDWFISPNAELSITDPSSGAEASEAPFTPIAPFPSRAQLMPTT